MYQLSNNPQPVRTSSGETIDFETAVFYMDDDLREELHAKLAPCDNQKFFSAYERAHREKFNEEFELPG